MSNAAADALSSKCKYLRALAYHGIGWATAEDVASAKRVWDTAAAELPADHWLRRD